MRFTARGDLALPIAAVHAALSDVDHYEAEARARGARLERHGTGGEGTEWDIAFRFRGRERQLRARLLELRPPGRLRLTWEGRLTRGEAVVELVALARGRTRLALTIDVLPKTLPARLFLQSLRLVKPRLNRRFRARVAEALRRLEARAAARSSGGAPGGGGARSGGPAGDGAPSGGGDRPDRPRGS